MELARSTHRVELHTNKGQAQASTWAREELAKTPGHPSVSEAEMLMLTSSLIRSFSPLVPASAQMFTSDVGVWELMCGTTEWEQCPYVNSSREAISAFRDATPGSGAYFGESDYFEPDFQEAFWGTENYDRLLAI